MFVKYIEDKDVFNNGFVLNPLFNESFNREKIDTTYLSTHMQVWVDVNSYRYKVVTDREGAVEYGCIFSKEVLEGLVHKFFLDDKINFLRRNLPKVHGFDNVTMHMVSNSLRYLPEKTINKIFITNFGENLDEHRTA